MDNAWMTHPHIRMVLVFGSMDGSLAKCCLTMQKKA